MLRAVVATPPQQLRLLACVVQLQNSTGRSEARPSPPASAARDRAGFTCTSRCAQISIDTLKERHADHCRQHPPTSTPTESEQSEMIARLCSSRLLAPAASPGLLRLVVQAGDVRHAVKEQGGLYTL